MKSDDEYSIVSFNDEDNASLNEENYSTNELNQILDNDKAKEFEELKKNNDIMEQVESFSSVDTLNSLSFNEPSIEELKKDDDIMTQGESVISDDTFNEIEFTEPSILSFVEELKKDTDETCMLKELEKIKKDNDDMIEHVEFFNFVDTINKPHILSFVEERLSTDIVSFDGKWDIEKGKDSLEYLDDCSLSKYVDNDCDSTNLYDRNQTCRIKFSDGFRIETTSNDNNNIYLNENQPTSVNIKHMELEVNIDAEENSNFITIKLNDKTKVRIRINKKSEFKEKLTNINKKIDDMIGRFAKKITNFVSYNHNVDQKKENDNNQNYEWIDINDLV
jgi:hypothetical protein